MLLVETHIIKKSHILYKECNHLCFLSKNLYNTSLYNIKIQYEKDNSFFTYHQLSKKFSSENNVDYRALPAKVSQQIMMILERNYKSYFKSLNSYRNNPYKFKGVPKPPSFKHKINGRNIVSYTSQSISKIEFKKNGLIKLSGTDISFNTKIVDFKLIKQVRIVPLKNNTFKIEVVYNKQELPNVVSNGLTCGIDIGLNNLFAVAFSDQSKQSIIISGRPLKSINQYYNKKRADIQNKLGNYIDKNGDKKQIKKSKRLYKLTTKRNNKINDYVHNSTKILVKKLKQNNVSRVVIGKNDYWKDEINIGKKNNQNFVSLPHARIIDVLKYKLELIGVEVILREESYTSKCSLIDMEPIKKHIKYIGNRIERGLFMSKDKTLINADINGAGNILRKELPNAFADGIEGLVVSPRVLKVQPLKNKF